MNVFNNRLKFRVYDKEEKSLSIDAERYFIRPNGSLGDFCDGDEERASSEYDIQWSTGLKDKNEKLIFEGDIVSVHSEFYDADPWFVVKCNDDGLIILDTDAGLANPPLFTANKKCEVIGNIHENPEMNY